MFTLACLWPGPQGNCERHRMVGAYLLWPEHCVVAQMLVIAAGVGMMITLKEPKTKLELQPTTQAKLLNMLAGTLLAAPLTQPDLQPPQLATKQTQLARQLGELDAKQKTTHGGQLIELLTRLRRGPDMLQTKLLMVRSGLKIALKRWVSTLAERQLRLKAI